MRIPTDITPLEYIAGSGSQYIETAIHLLSTDVVKSKWRFQNSAGNVYGCFTSSSADDNFCLYAGSASTYAYIRYNGQLVRDFKATSGTVYEIEQGPDGFFVGGSKVAYFDAATFTCSAPMYIFMLPNSSSAKVTARCYGLRVIRGGVMAYDFIPARNEATGEVGMWEAVHGVWYGNDGTGAFTAGGVAERVLGTTHDGWRRRLMMAASKHYEIVPGSDGRIWAYYDVTDISTPTKLLNSTSGMTSMEVDGVQQSVSATYQFSGVGEHLVKFQPASISTAQMQFENCTALLRCYLPQSITTIAQRSFFGCSSLLFINLENITTLSGISQFYQTNLSEADISMPLLSNPGDGYSFGQTHARSIIDLGTITNIGGNFFIGASIAKIIVPATVTQIGAYSFANFDISNPVVVFLPTAPPTPGTRAIRNFPVGGKIYVPYSSDHSILSAYQAASQFSTYASRIYELNPDGTIPTA